MRSHKGGAEGSPADNELRKSAFCAGTIATRQKNKRLDARGRRRELCAGVFAQSMNCECLLCADSN